MRIVHTALRYPPATGGVETYVHELVERTRNVAEQRDVRVLTSKLRTHGPISELAPEDLLSDPPYVQRLHHASTPCISYPRLQALNYYLGHHQPDIVHGYSFWYQPADVAARYARKHDKPFILHPMYYNHGVRQKWQWQLYKNTVGHKTFMAADIVVVISPYEQALIEKDNYPVKRFELLPPGVNVDEITQAATAPDPFSSRGINGHIVLAVNRIAPSKGLDTLIGVLPAVLKVDPIVQVVIIGEDFGVQDSLIKQAERLGVTKNVHFVGKFSNAELYAAYNQADILVNPTHYEAFGIGMAEALAAGLPVIARNVAAVPYVVPHEKVGLLFASDGELVTAITTLLKNDSLRTQYGQAGKHYIAENFTWDRTVTKLLDLYAELV